MDLIYLITIAIALLIVIVSFIFFKKSNAQKVEKAPVRAGVVPERLQAGVPRRAQIARNQRDRNRNRGAVNVDNNTVSDHEQSDEDNDEKLNDFGNEKIGTKKRAKLEAKAEKKSQREVELKIREEKKQKDLLAADEKIKIDALEQEEEKRRDELLLQAEKEKEKVEYEHYLQLKEAFSVEEEGFEEDDEDKNQLEDFVNYIKENKVVILEDLATTFKLKAQAAIERITDLQNNGSITGVIDDRGKFIFISEDELRQVAKFVKQRGRITITELAESSNKLINLTPAVAVIN